MVKRLFARVDDALIDRVFQPIVDKIGERTSLGGFRMARLVMDMASFAWIVSQANGTARALAAGPFALLAWRFSVTLFGLVAFSILRAPFQRAGGGRGGAANPLRATMQLHRAAALVWLPGLLCKTALAPAALEPVALLAVGVLTTAALYAGACSNPPIARRSARQPVGQRELASVRTR